MRRANKLPFLNPKAFRIVYNKEGSIRQQWIQFQYLCKGLDQNARLARNDGSTVLAADLIRFGYESPGQVLCKKRYGVSKNIRAKQRQSFGFESLMDIGVLDVGKLYRSDTSNSETVPDPVDELTKILNTLGL